MYTQKLGEDKVALHRRRATFKKAMQQLTQQYEAAKAQLNDNETYTQVGEWSLITGSGYPYKKGGTTSFSHAEEAGGGGGGHKKFEVVLTQHGLLNANIK